MSNTEDHIADLTQSVQDLTDTVNDKLSAIDARVTAAEAALDARASAAEMEFQDYITQGQAARPMVNLLEANGRYDSSATNWIQFEPDSVFFDQTPLTAKARILHHNVGAVEECTRHYNNSSTYGGTRPANDALAVELLDAFPDLSTEDRFDLPEFRVAKYTVFHEAINPHGDHADLHLGANPRVYTAFGPVTMGLWFKPISGTFALRKNRLYIDGIKQEDHVVRPRIEAPQGWMHLATFGQPRNGFLRGDMIFASAGAEYAIALPFVSPGDFTGVIHTAPVVSA